MKVKDSGLNFSVRMTVTENTIPYMFENICYLHEHLTYYILLPNSGTYIIDNIMSYWLVGSIISFYFFQFKISFANSFLQLTLYGIVILAYIFNEFTSKINFNLVIVLICGVIINLINIILYRNKNFVTNYYKY